MAAWAIKLAFIIVMFGAQNIAQKIERDINLCCSVFVSLIWGLRKIEVWYHPVRYISCTAIQYNNLPQNQWKQKMVVSGALKHKRLFQAILGVNSKQAVLFV